MFQKRFLLMVGIALLLPAAAFAQPPYLGFAAQMGGTTSDSGASVAVDSVGNVYTAGIFSGTADFDPGAGTANLTSAGSFDTFVSKFDASGDFLWARRMGGSGSLTEARSIVLDGLGNVYTTGDFSGTADFDPGAGNFNLTPLGSDIFVSKLDASGNFVWAVQMGGSSGLGSSIALDGTGNVYTTGYFGGTADFDPGAGTSNLTSGGIDDIFVSRLDSSGNFLWVRQMGGAGDQEASSIVLDSFGNVYTTGYFDGTSDFDPGAGTANLTSGGISDVFVSKLDASGNFLWARQMGGTDSEVGWSIAVDSSGNVYTTGYFNGTSDFDPGAGTFALTPLSGSDIFISKLDTSGNFLWARQIGGVGAGNNGLSIAVDGSDNAYTTGYFNGTVDFDPGAGTFNLTDAGTGDIFVSKLDASGAFVWAWGTGGTGLDRGSSVVLDGSDNVYIAGFFSGTADFDPGAGTANLTSAGALDIFVSRLEPVLSVPAANLKAIFLTALLLAVCIGFAVRRSRKPVAL